MNRSRTMLAGLALASLGWTQSTFTPYVPMKEEQMYIEYTVNANEATVVVAAESEIAIRQLEVQNPAGNCVLGMSTNHLVDSAVQGFVVETREEPLFAILNGYAPGHYRIYARTADGRTAVGGAHFSHVMPAAPIIDYPLEGQRGVPLDFVAQWQPDSTLERYQLTLGQGEDDLLDVLLPPNVTSLAIPPGVLEPGLETFLEIAAIHPEGNRTLLEISFEVE